MQSIESSKRLAYVLQADALLTIQAWISLAKGLMEREKNKLSTIREDMHWLKTPHDIVPRAECSHNAVGRVLICWPIILALKNGSFRKATGFWFWLIILL